MDEFEALTETITEAVNRCVASIEQLANAIRRSETQCGHIKRKNKRKNKRPAYCKGKRLHDGYKRIVRTREGFRK